jgi:hypothetical protein
MKEQTEVSGWLEARLVDMSPAKAELLVKALKLALKAAHPHKVVRLAVKSNSLAVLVGGDGRHDVASGKFWESIVTFVFDESLEALPICENEDPKSYGMVI